MATICCADTEDLRQSYCNMW